MLVATLAVGSEAGSIAVPAARRTAGMEAPAPGARLRINYTELRRQFAEPDWIHAPFAFWFWDEPVRPKKQERMARAMLSQHLNPGYAHARMSMVGTPDLPRRQWLSPMWFEAFGNVLEATATAGGYFGYCDEYWWPSGRAAGRVLEQNPDLWTVSLHWKTIEVEAGHTVALPASFFTVAARLTQAPEPPAASPPDLPIPAHTPAQIESTSLRLVGMGDPMSWKAPDSGTWRVYSFYRYYHPGADGGRLNYLDSRLAPAFLELAHAPYAVQFEDYFDRTLPGVFVDHEGDYGYKLAWSGDLDRRYGESTGRDLRLDLPLLLDRDREGRWGQVRWAWFDAVSDLYARHFERISGWLADRGLYCISNLWEESLMWQASAVGDFFKVQRSFSLPGTDCLGLSILKAHDFKETQSVAEFEGRRFQSEIMGAAGWWGFNPVTLKQAANAATAWGISHVVTHGIFTTRRLTGNPWLPDWYRENPLWNYLHLWTDFVRRAAYVNAHGHTAPDVLLVNPMDSVWALAGPGVFDPAYPGRVPCPPIQPLPTAADIPRSREALKRESAWWTAPVMDGWYTAEVQELNAVYSEAIETLADHRIEFLVADRHYLGQMRIESGRLRHDPFEFHTVVLPPLYLLPRATMELITRFAEAGGTVLALGRLPDGSAEAGMEDPEMDRLAERLRRAPQFTEVPEGLAAGWARDLPGLESPVRFLSGAFPMRQQHRRIDKRDFFWLANNTGQTQECRVEIRDATGSFSRWDCETGQIHPAPSTPTPQGSELRLAFDEYEAFWLVADPVSSRTPPKTTAPPPSRTILTVDGRWRVNFAPLNQPVLEGPPKLPPEWKDGSPHELSLDRWKNWGLAEFSGHLDYRKTIHLESIPKGTILLDLGAVLHMATVWINGELAGRRLWPPYRFEITDLLQPGENFIHIRVGNLVNNHYGDTRDAGLLGPVRFLIKPVPAPPSSQTP